MKSLGWAFTASVVIAIIFYAISIDYTNIQAGQFSALPILLSVVVGLLYRSWCAFVWLRILRSLATQSKIRLPGALLVFATAWLGRYIPGKLAGIATKTYMAPTVGMSREISAIAAVSESVIQLASTLIFCALLVIAEPRLSEHTSFVLPSMLSVAGLLLILIYPPIFQRVVRFGAHFAGREIANAPDVLDNRSMIASAGLYVLGAVISGAGFFLLSLGFAHDYVGEHALFLVAAYNVAGVLGMIAFFAPSGIGIKDGALLIALSVILPSDVALLLTAVARIWVLIVDLLFFWLAKMNARLFR